jgi:hypothetical protein
MSDINLSYIIGGSFLLLVIGYLIFTIKIENRWGTTGKV